MENQYNQPIETDTQWGIVEIMGRKIIAGKISKSEMLGAPMLRIDIPATSAFPEFTQFYGSQSIYSVTFTSEEAAIVIAESVKADPVCVYVPDLSSAKRLEAYKEENEMLREAIERLKHLLPARAIKKLENDGV